MKGWLVWLCVGLLLVVFQGCNPAKRDTSRSSGQSGTQVQAESPIPVSESTGIVKAAHTAKDDGKGAPGEKTDTFGPADRTIHCVVELAEASSGTKIRFSWLVVDAEGAQNERIQDFEYTTRREDRTVHGHLTVPKDWPPGNYRVEVYVDGNLERIVDYSVT